LADRSEASLSLGRKIFYVSVIVAAVPLIYLFVGRGMRFFRVPSNSMEPTILISDFLMTLRQDEYHRGDVVVLRDPFGESGYIVKRIVGLEGDRVSVHGGGVFIDGGYVSEPYLLEEVDYQMPDYDVNSGEIFLLGDNRNWSVDSHNWLAGQREKMSPQPGGVPIDLIVGRVLYIYLPIDRMHKLNSYPLRHLGASD